jgi:hypothetical protein
MARAQRVGVVSWGQPQSRSDGKFKLGWDFVDVGPFRQIHKPVLKHDASIVVHDQTNRGLRGIISFLVAKSLA